MVVDVHMTVMKKVNVQRRCAVHGIFLGCLLVSLDVQTTRILKHLCCARLAITRSTLFAVCPTPENRDVWLFGEAVQQYPGLAEVCNNLLSDDVARECSGTGADDEGAGSTGTTGGDRKRRADAKRRAAEASVRVGTSTKKMKPEASASGLTEHFKEVVATVVEAFKPEPMGTESGARGSSASTADSACVEVKVLDAHMESHGRCIESLEKETAKGGKANPVRLQLLKQQAAMLEKKLEELMENDL